MRALAALREEGRELLTLVSWHGLSPCNAARVIGCSTASYFVRLHRARKRQPQARSSPTRSGSARFWLIRRIVIPRWHSAVMPGAIRSNEEALSAAA
jgi:sigma-70-like protein